MQRAGLYWSASRGRAILNALVSRQLVIDSKFSTVISAPVYSRHDGLSTQVKLGPEHGLKHESSIHWD